MKRGKQVYYRESSDDDEHVVANLTDSAEDEKHGSEEEGDYVQANFVEEDLLNPDISQILTWRTDRAISGTTDNCKLLGN
jgi:hypothetical protein